MTTALKIQGAYVPRRLFTQPGPIATNLTRFTGLISHPLFGVLRKRSLERRPRLQRTRQSAQNAGPRAKNASPANVRSGGYVSAPSEHTHIPGLFLARRPEGQSFQKFLNRPGASAV